MSYTFRPINVETDFESFYNLYRVELTEKFGGFNMSEEEVRAEFDTPKFNIATDSYAAFTEDGTMVASTMFFAVRELNVFPMFFGYVHPEHRNQGIGTTINQWAIERGKKLIPTVPDDARIAIQAWANTDADIQLFEALGFSNNRKSYQMRIEFDEAPPAVEFPEHIQVITYAEHPVLEDFVRIQNAAFRDHRGSVEEPLENIVARWQNSIDAAKDFTPELFFMLKDGDKDVGVTLAWPASEEEADRGHIDVVGITREYRRQGLALKLLQYAFGELYKRGVKKVALGVDAESLTGATKLYEKAGMYIGHVHHGYAYEIRAGIEYSNQGQQTTETA